MIEGGGGISGGGGARSSKIFSNPTNNPQKPPVPKGSITESDIKGGTVYRAPGTTGDAGTIRVMPPTQQYPNGYWKQHNAHGQPINPWTDR